MNFIEKRLIQNKIQRHRQLYACQNLYSLLNSSEFNNSMDRITDYKTANDVVNMYISCDKTVAVPLEVGRNIEDLVASNNITVGVHRTDVFPNVYESNISKGILREGLHNYGDATSGSIRKRPDVTKTVFLTNKLYNFMLSCKNSYKGSTGAFVLCFPKKDLNEEGTITNENSNIIYNEQNNIRPEFILGYIDNSYGVMNFVSRKDLLYEMRKRELENVVNKEEEINEDVKDVVKHM